MTSGDIAAPEAALPFIDPLNEQPGSFSGSAALFMRTAHDMGVQVTEGERRGWHTLFELAYAIDEEVDDRQGDIAPFIGGLLADEDIEGTNAGLRARVRNYMDSLSPARRDHALTSILHVGELVSRQRQARTADDLIQTRLEEAELFASLLALPTEGYSDEPQRIRFNNWIRGFSRCGYTVDSFLDVRSDYEDGSTSLKPTMGSRLALGRSALRESFIAVRLTPTQTLGKSALVAIKYFIVARKPAFANNN